MTKISELTYEIMPCFLQNILISCYGEKIKMQRFNKRFFYYFDIFDKIQYSSIDELISFQNQKLRQLINHVYYNVPFYRNIFNERKLVPSDIKCRDDLYKLPIITKRDIKNNFPDFISKDKSINNLKKGHTSGTTGSPFELLWDHNIGIVNNAVLWQYRSWGGFKFGMKYATLLGRTIVPLKQQKKPFYRINYPWKQYLFSSFHLTPQNIESYFDELDKNDIHILEAYPSTAYILARYLEHNNLFYKMNAVFTSSETLLPLQRELIEYRFQC
ncbi:MAG TPA: hypothetical protein ENJ28_10780, partial [Gammaproteobacteria bacterium]|nr:hypothetical protein [Gammaproteobacteria bacterium]